MKRDSPAQYQRFLESKAASESWRKMQEQNERSRSSRRLDREYKEAVEAAEASAMSNISHTASPPPPRTATPIRPTAFASHGAGRGKENDTDPITAGQEVPWYKRRPDISDFASEMAEKNRNVDRDTPSTETALPNKYKHLMNKNLDDSSKIHKLDDDVGTVSSKKKSGVFASISKSALNMRDANGVTSTSIPFSELFPTLYANDSQKKEEKDRKPVNPAMMYEENQFEAYHEAMEAVFADHGANKAISKFEAKGGEEKRVVQIVKQWLLNDHRIIDQNSVKERWNNVEQVWKGEKWMTGIVGERGEESTEPRFICELKAQQEIFLSKLLEEDESFLASGESASSSDEGSSKRSGDLASEDIENPICPILFHEITQHIMGTLGRYCARRARSSPMVVAWWKVKESGLLLSKSTISTYLYVVSLMGMADSLGSSSGIGISSYPISDNEKGRVVDSRDAIPEEVATYHDLASKPTESSISLRVKAMACKGDANKAEELLVAFQNSIEADQSSDELMRLRTYLPILKHYCETGEIGSALSLFKRMQYTPGVILEPETYVLLIASIAENKYFCEKSSPIEGAQHLGYSCSNGPGLFDDLVAEMSCDVLEISSASARRLYNSLAVGFQNESNSDNEDIVVSTLKEVHPLMSMPVARQSAEHNEVVASRVSLDRSTGICPVTDAQQRLIILEPDQRIQLHDDLLNLSTEQFAKYAGKKSDDSPNRAREQLQKFSDWLNQRQGEPFTAIVDGANIGYYMQSFDKGRFNYHQVKFMVDTLEERGENPLVIVPHKYGYSQFYSTKREHQRLDQAEIEIMNDLTKSGKLYRVPPRCLDDFYWMLASVSDQTASRNARDLSVSNNDPDHRFPGTRPMLISNDQMRDHRLELLEPRLFRRWYGCHIVNYNFTAFVLGESVAGNEVGFSPADFFSREIQGNQCPDNGCWNSQAWHFPVSDW
eukprot:CAMPEP_0181081076 /NCGR_PEP_ID=MMETSP1071-20121207/2912_1 /TAXON_ID=35127 /ORGANISM="Thalassiosira sp., Strain NH16" /LENGTH=947 /DNA_ID=CAMNT_0023162605 /DNA_START=375 /DNA_END=3216 /DNA_ORIENTATION=+